MKHKFASKGLKYHERSISLPSRLSHPTPQHIEAELNKLRTFLDSPNSSSSSDNIKSCLLMVAELHSSVRELIESPSTQQSLLQRQNRVVVEEALDKSLHMLDSCSRIQCLVSSVKGRARELESAMRRKGAEPLIQQDIIEFLSFVKRARREAIKSLRKIKDIENRMNFFNGDHCSLMVIRVLSEVCEITVSSLRFVLSFLSCSATQNNRWSLIISRLMLNKSEMIINNNNVVQGNIDVVLASLQRIIKINEDFRTGVQIARKRLKDFEDGIESVEDGLDCLYRHMIQSRVSLLNILTHC